MIRWTWLAGVATLCAFGMGVVSADSWVPPQTRSYLSPDKAWRLTVFPREITSPLAYFEDKVADRPKAGGVPGSKQVTASALMEHLHGGRWQAVWKKPLVNEVSPVDALASNAGQAVTFDNWHSMGYGKDVIAIYDAAGSLVRALALEDFLPKEYIRPLPQSVSSMYWRGEPRISEDGRQLIVPIVIPDADQEGFPDEEKTAYVDARFDLASGHPLTDDSPAWSEALASARNADQKLKEEQAAERQRFISPLAAPTTGKSPDWYSYLVDAFFRIDPEWDDGYPSTHVIPLPTDEKFDLLSGYVGVALTDDINEDGAIMFASPSQDVLVDVLMAQAKRAKAGSLPSARIYVAADDKHVDAARKALAHTGAKFIQIDIDQEIPQQKERLDRYLKRLDEN